MDAQRIDNPNIAAHRPTVAAFPNARLPKPFSTPAVLGEIGAQWQFPSDHVPVAAEISGIKVGSWNVLNSKSVHYFEKGKLSASNLITDHVPVRSDSPVTRREIRTIEIAVGLLEKLDILLLQECSAVFIEEFCRRLPKNFLALRGRAGWSDNDILTIFNREKLSLDPSLSEITRDAYACKSNRPILNLLFETKIGAFRVIHTHVPGNPKDPGLEQLAQYLKDRINLDTPTIVAGDFNFEGARIVDVFSGAGINDFLSVVELNTSFGIETPLCSKGIDHILAFAQKGACRQISSHELSPEIAVAVALLNPTQEK